MFEPEIPDVIILSADGSLAQGQAQALEAQKTLDELREECTKNGQDFTQVSSEIFTNLITGGYCNGAFNQLKYELYLHTNYQKTVSITSIPVFYLEPNSRVTIHDTTTNTYGDYMVPNISLTLGPGANMNISCSQISERYF